MPTIRSTRHSRRNQTYSHRTRTLETNSTDGSDSRRPMPQLFPDDSQLLDLDNLAYPESAIFGMTATVAGKITGRKAEKVTLT